MADVVCRCGTYIRAYVPPGSKVTCSQCGEVLSIGRTIDPSADKATSNSDKFSANSNASLISTSIKVVLTLAALMIVGALAYRFWIQNPKSNVESATRPESLSPPIEPTISRPENPAKWSSMLNWNSSITEIPYGAQLQQAASEIASQGTFDNPQALWSKLDSTALSNDSQGFSQASLTEFLKNSGHELLSGQSGSVCSDWKVIGLRQSEGQTGVLVRYFHEPVTKDIELTGEWIDKCRQLISIEEFESITKDIFNKTTQSSVSTNQAQIPNGQMDQAHLMYFAPSFGYLILLFEADSAKIAFKDVLSIPGEIPISRATQWNTSKDRKVGSSQGLNRFVDIFGEYQAISDSPFSQLIYFGSSEEELQTPGLINKTIETIPQIRNRRLIEIAEAAIRDPGMLNTRMMRFRKDFPDDLGADALLLSIWGSGQRSKRANASYDDAGRVMVDAAHRLYMKTSDPLLLEIKSRIYLPYGRRQDADKSLSEAEQASHRSFFLIERRIQESIESKDQVKLKEQLARLNEYFISKPQELINPELKLQWTKNLSDWQAQSQSK